MARISVIIPFKGNVSLLNRLLKSIPDTPSIQVIVADNNPNHYKRTDFSELRDIELIDVEPTRGAGGARNEALKYAKGDWLVFADADDYFDENAFDIFRNYINSNADLVYFKSKGVISNTGVHADRADYYCSLIDNFINNPSNENDEALRYFVGVPWGKMYRRAMVEENGIVFDEIVAGNDAFFSLACGYYANSVSVINKTLYVVTVSKGTLTQRRDAAVVKARLYSRLHCNQFLRQHGLSRYQYSVMYYLTQTFRFGMKEFFDSLFQVIRFRQNPFVGSSHWLVAIKRKLIK